MRGYEATKTSQKEPFQMKKSTADQRIQQLTLDLLPEKAIEVAFDGDDVSPNGGLLLVAQAEKLTGLLRGMVDRMDDRRTASLVKHNLFEQVAQRVFQIVAGFPASDDCDFLRDDPVLKTAVGRAPLSGANLASQPTQSRLETSRSFKELYRLCVWLVEYYIECHPKAPKRLVLDFDGSAIETYGIQLNAFYRSGPYGKFMYFPLFVFDENGWLLVAALRPGDQGEVELALPVLKRLVKRLRAAWPTVEIIIRADGAFTNNTLYKWMDENRVKYVLGIKHNNALLSKSKFCRKEANRKFNRKYGQPQHEGRKGKKERAKKIKEIRAIADCKKRMAEHKEFTGRYARSYGDFKYQAKSWDRERRVIARCDRTDEGLDVRYIVTNIEKPVAKVVYEDLYCGRATCEAWIKNIKQTKCERMSCRQFKSNFFRLLLHAFAYNLIYQVQLRLSERTSVAQFQRNFIHVAVHVEEWGDLVRFHIARSYHAAKAFRLASRRLGAQTPQAA